MATIAIPDTLSPMDRVNKCLDKPNRFGRQVMSLRNWIESEDIVGPRSEPIIKTDIQVFSNSACRNQYVAHVTLDGYTASSRLYSTRKSAEKWAAKRQLTIETERYNHIAYYGRIMHPPYMGSR